MWFSIVMLNYQRVCGFAGKQATVPEDPLWWITMDHKLRAQPLAHRIHVCYIYNVYGTVTFTINIPQMLAYIYIYHTWILWVWINNWLRSDWIKLDQRWNLWNLGPRQERNRYGRYSRWCVRHFWSQVVVGKTPMVWMHCCLK